MGTCPNCGTELDVIVATGEGEPVSEEAAVQIARINADNEYRLAKLAAGTNAAMDEHFEAVAEIDANAEVEVAEILADALSEEAAIQPEDIGEAVADAIDDNAVTVIGDGDVNTGDEIQPLPDTEPEGEEVSDEAPTQSHWLTKKIG